MKVVIIEDEIPAASRLSRMLEQLEPGIDIVCKTDSVEQAIQYFDTRPSIHLVFMDIQLADGLSFSIFEQTTVPAPVIFTTAYDQYTLKAFKVNSIDYLLKPIDEKELLQALQKYKAVHQQPATEYEHRLMQVINGLQPGRYKERLLIKRGQQYSFLKLAATAYCYADGKLCYAVDFAGNRFLLEQNLGELEQQLQPDTFFRINRHMMLNIESIKKVHTWLGGRLKVEVAPTTTSETIVSRERVSDFKAWLGR
jgi:DNA-binding LytR/AlgR family response regulator